MKLIIVESPTKVKTISQFLPKEFVVKASIGHITKLKDDGLYNLGIDVKGDFDAQYEIDPKKKDTVKELKELVKRADEVYLCQDPDREGESIAWHLKEELDIPVKKLKRCTYTEVTKRAVEEALNHPRKIDMNLVHAAESRSKLDKIVGYRLSPIARNKVFCKSVGRCQSPALKLITEREEEILKFESKTYYEIWLDFEKDKNRYKAQYKGLIKDKKNITTINNKEDAEAIVLNCLANDFVVHDIISNDRTVSPKPPFITSTYQQEVSSKLGYSVKTAMNIAQKLFEGLEIGGQHVGLVTYLRTDSDTMDPEFQESLKLFITETYGDRYLGKLKSGKKVKNAQEGHECFRVVDLFMTPEKLSSYINDSQMLRVYKLIYNRTVASMMTESVITDTDYIINNSGYKFIYTEHSVKFDGFRKVYSLDDEEITNSIDLFIKEKLVNTNLSAEEKHTNPPRRYSEATLIKQLGDLSIGRPSTFATIISTLLDTGRGYAEEKGKAIAPTGKGMRLSKFLDEAFPDIINYEYSANLEESLDLIAKGKLTEIDFLKEFYRGLEEMIKKARSLDPDRPEVEEVGRECPKCGKSLVYRNGRFGKFIACSGWKPKGGCNYTEKI